MPYLPPEIIAAGRTPRGHPEGLREAFANIYAEIAQERMARALGDTPPQFPVPAHRGRRAHDGLHRGVRGVAGKRRLGRREGAGAMKVCVVGAGAIGGFIGARLAMSGHDVSAFARGATLSALRKHGWRLRQGGQAARRSGACVRPHASSWARTTWW